MNVEKMNARIDQAIRGIEADREQDVQNIRAVVMQEKVVPKNAEVDALRDNALQELQSNLSAGISALQEKFSNDRQAIVERSEQQKLENERNFVDAATASVIYEYNAKIAELKKLKRN